MDAFIQRRDVPLVGPVLKDSAIIFSSGPNGILGRRQVFSLGWPEENGDLRVAAKMAISMQKKLAASGCRVQMVVPPWPRMTRPDEPTVNGMTTAVSQLFRDPYSRCGALIRFARSAHPFAMVPDLLRAYPRVRAVVAVPSRDQIRGWTRDLNRAGLARPVLTSKEWRGSRHPLVVVTSLQMLDHCSDFDFDLVIVPDARVLRRIDGRPIDYDDPHPPRDYRLLRHWHIPAFGFLPDWERLHPGEERRMWSLFACTIEVG